MAETDDAGRGSTPVKMNPDEVQIYVKGILRDLREMGVLRTLFDSALSGADAVALLERVWTTLDIPTGPLIGVGGVAATPKGPLVTIHGVNDSEQARSLLIALADGIANEGVGGALRAVPQLWTPVHNPDAALFGVVAGVCLKGHYDPLRPTYWIPALGSVEAVVEAALEWCQIPGGKNYACAASSNIECSTEQRRALVSTSLGWGSTTTLVSALSPDQIRTVEFGYEGTVYFGRLDPDNSWEPAVADLTRVLASVADHVQYGVIRRARIVQGLWDEFLAQRWPSISRLPGGVPRGGRTVVHHTLPEAHGVQLLGPDHILPSTLPEHWSSTRAGLDSMLLAHLHPAAWFEGSVEAWYGGLAPDSLTLQEARADLEPLLLTDERAQEAYTERFSLALPPQIRLP